MDLTGIVPNLHGLLSPEVPHRLNSLLVVPCFEVFDPVDVAAGLVHEVKAVVIYGFSPEIRRERDELSLSRRRLHEAAIGVYGSNH